MVIIQIIVLLTKGGKGDKETSQEDNNKANISKFNVSHARLVLLMNMSTKGLLFTHLLLTEFLVSRNQTVPNSPESVVVIETRPRSPPKSLNNLTRELLARITSRIHETFYFQKTHISCG
jgi:hypothetical protein